MDLFDPENISLVNYYLKVEGRIKKKMQLYNHILFKKITKKIKGVKDIKVGKYLTQKNNPYSV